MKFVYTYPKKVYLRFLQTIIFLAVCLSSVHMYGQTSTCESPANNANGDTWSPECYLNNTCGLQGNPCQANDVRITGVFLADATGNPLPACTMTGQTVPNVYLWANFNNNTGTSRYAIRAYAELFLNNTFLTSANGCAFDELPSGGDGIFRLLGPFTYTCGDVIELKNTWIAWETSAGTCLTVTTCNQYSPAKCFRNTVTSINPLIVNFTTQCTGFQVCMTSSVTGGNPNYTYTWDFGDGSPPSNAVNPCHTYTTQGNYTIIMKVTDNNGTGVMGAVTQNVTVPCCTSPTISCPQPANLPSCSTAAQIQAAYDAWKAGFMVTGGCNPVSNSANIPPLPTFVCGGAINLNFVFSVTDASNTSAQTCSASFVVNAATPLSVSCPQSANLPSCSTAAQIQAAYDTWKAGFVVSGGCSPSSNTANIPALPAFVCGGAVNLNFVFSVTDACNTSAQTCSASFVVNAATPLSVSCPQSANLPSCSTAAQIQAAYDTWKAGFVVSGGCSPSSNTANIPALPAFVCGGAVNLNFVFSVTDACNTSAQTCSASFVVNAATPLSVSCPQSANLPSCSTAAQIQAAYDTWKAGFVVSGGCSPSSNTANIPALPAFVCGGAVNLNFVFSVTDACNTSAQTCSASFVVNAATPLSVSCPQSANLPSCSTAAQIQAAYDTWKAGFVVSGGCSPSSNTANIPALPPFVCGGAVNLNFVFSVTDACNTSAQTCSASFVVNAATPLSVSCPQSANLPSCSTAAQIQAAYDTWKAGFVVSGGCSPSTNIALLPTLPTFSCKGVNLNFTYSVTDACNTSAKTCSGSFVVNADNTPPTITSCPQNAVAIYECINDIPAANTGAVQATDACGATKTTVSTTETGAPCTNLPYIRTYTYTVTDGCGNTATCQEVYRIDICPQGGMIKPELTKVCGAVPVTLTLSGHVGTVKKWQKQINCTGAWIDIPNTAGLTVYTFTTVPNTNCCFRAVLGCNDVFSTVARVEADTPPIGGFISLAYNPNVIQAAICPNASITLKVNGSVGKIFGWQFNPMTSPAWIDIPNSTMKPTLVVNGSSLTMTTFYRAILCSPFGTCTGNSSFAYSSVFKVSMKANCAPPPPPPALIYNSNVPSTNSVFTSKAYPVPSSDKVTLDIEGANEGNASFEIFDLTGKLALKDTRYLQLDRNEVNVDISKLAQGSYLVRITDSEKQQFTLRIHKQD